MVRVRPWTHAAQLYLLFSKSAMSLGPPASESTNAATGIKYSRSLTSAEKATLEEWLPEYLNLERTLGKKYDGFWEPKWQIFFERHPLPPLTAQEIANGVDQGDRKGERIAHMKHVSTYIISFRTFKLTA